MSDRAKRVFDNVIDAVGDTPIVRLNSVTKGLDCEIYVKLEFCNPGGSVKDRIGLEMIEDAEREGRLKPGGTIVEATSGNTGIGLAMVAATRGYKCVFVMPDKMSDEKVRNLRAFGARVVITPTAVAPEDPRSYYSVSKRLSQEIPNAILANQYHNPANPRAHYKLTGPEIWRQMPDLDYLVLGLGTGGTVTGTGKFLKEKNPKIEIVGVDPEGSVYYEFWRTGVLPSLFKTYKTEGVGEDFMPGTIDFQYINHVVQSSDKETFTMTRRLTQEEGIFGGGSSGMAVMGAVKFAREKKLPKGKKLLVLLPDGGGKYLSKIFNDDWMREYGFLDPDEKLGKVSDLVAAKAGDGVITARASDPVGRIIQLMKEKGISQLPVVDGDKLVGIITEVALLNYMLEGGHQLDKPIAPIVEKDTPTVPPDASIGKLREIFSKGKVAVVVDAGKVAGIVTKIDMIDFLAHKVA